MGQVQPMPVSMNKVSLEKSGLLVRSYRWLLVATAADLNLANRLHVTRKARLVDRLAVYRNCLPAPGSRPPALSVIWTKG